MDVSVRSAFLVALYKLAQHARRLPIQSQVHGVAIGKEIGCGGFGIVYEGKLGDQRVAIKTIRVRAGQEGTMMKVRSLRRLARYVVLLTMRTIGHLPRDSCLETSAASKHSPVPRCRAGGT